MLKKTIALPLLACCLLGSLCCVTTSRAQQVNKAMIQDAALGIAFMPVGSASKIDPMTYQMTLPQTENAAAQPALIQITATDRKFVDLPGSYGGRLYLDEPAAARMTSNRVFTDSVKTVSGHYGREYWVVYAGMGMWDAVINCTAQQAGRYYVVSLVQQVMAGKPGQDTDSTPLTADALKAKVLSALQDTTNANVREFTNMLNTVQVSQ